MHISPSTKITPFLMLKKPEEAAEFYVSIFKESSRITNISRGSDVFVSVSFELSGQPFIAISGPEASSEGPVSFFIHCETQDEVDHYWAALSAGGEEKRCGWLKDKFGVLWQVIPKELGGLLQHPDPAIRGKAMQNMLKMKKIEVTQLTE